jgi:UDPglucose--hexose-1-phosphate uridylyltransferase
MPELRKDPVSDRWVIIATERSRRPHDFARESVPAQPSGRFCPFCPGHEAKTPPEVFSFRDGSEPNSPGWSLRVVPNKFPVLGIEGDLNREGEGLFDRMEGIGAHEVVIESPDHALSMTDLSESAIERVLTAFRERVNDLRNDRRLKYVLLFKNHGEGAGATLEHTHSQLIALPVVPKVVAEELEMAEGYYDFKERCLFCDLIRQETRTGDRVVMENEEFVALEPYAARFPFETWILPRRHRSHYERTERNELAQLAATLKSTLSRLEQVLERPPYNVVIHTAPMQAPENAFYHWHVEIIPKLTRVAGFEWGTGFHINPTTPEEAARYLREAVPALT